MTETSSPETDSLPTRPSLVLRLRDWREQEAWAEFYHTYERLVQGIARKRGLSAHDAEEVAQKVFQRVAQTIQDFEPRPHRGSFRKWLGNLARWKSGEVARSNGRQPGHGLPPVAWAEEEVANHGGGTIPVPVSPDDPEGELETATRRELVEAALQRLRLHFGDRQLQVYQLLVIEGWAVRKVAEFCRVSTTNVYVIKHRVGARLQAELKSLRQELNE